MKLFKEKPQKNLDKQKLPDHIVTIDDKNFDKFINKYPLCIVDFWAPWCKPCRTMGPRIRRLSSLYKDKLAFGKLDIQKYKKISEKYKIMSIPTMILFKNGKQRSTIYGIKSVGDIKKIIEKYI